MSDVIHNSRFKSKSLITLISALKFRAREDVYPNGNGTVFYFQNFLKMNTTDSEGDCDSDCRLDHWAGFWIEGVVLPLIAALGIAGVENC